MGRSAKEKEELRLYGRPLSETPCGSLKEAKTCFSNYEDNKGNPHCRFPGCFYNEDPFPLPTESKDNMPRNAEPDDLDLDDDGLEPDEDEVKVVAEKPKAKLKAKPIKPTSPTIMSRTITASVSRTHQVVDFEPVAIALVESVQIGECTEDEADQMRAELIGSLKIRIATEMGIEDPEEMSEQGILIALLKAFPGAKLAKKKARAKVDDDDDEEEEAPRTSRGKRAQAPARGGRPSYGGGGSRGASRGRPQASAGERPFETSEEAYEDFDDNPRDWYDNLAEDNPNISHKATKAKYYLNRLDPKLQKNY